MTLVKEPAIIRNGSITLTTLGKNDEVVIHTFKSTNVMILKSYTEDLISHEMGFDEKFKTNGVLKKGIDGVLTGVRLPLIADPGNPKDEDLVKQLWPIQEATVVIGPGRTSLTAVVDDDWLEKFYPNEHERMRAKGFGNIPIQLIAEFYD
jgi:hypothetical protein